MADLLLTNLLNLQLKINNHIQFYLILNKLLKANDHDVIKDLTKLCTKPESI